MAENKIISYDVELLSTNKRREFYIPEVYTNDLYTNEFQFNIIDMTAAELSGATATVLLDMKDGSFFNNADVTKIGNTFKYVLKENEGNHFGVAEVQLVVKISGKDYATPLYKFAVMQGLDDRKANEVVINDLNSETRKAINDLKTKWQQVIDETTGKDIVSAPEIIAARNGEANLKTRLDKEKQEVTAQLQQTEQDLTAQLAQNKKQKQVYGEVRLPENFPLTLDFNLFRKSDGIIYHDINAKHFKIGTKIYVSMAGTSVSDGLTPDTPTRTISDVSRIINGIEDENIIIVFLDHFFRATFWENALINLNKNLYFTSALDSGTTIINGSINMDWTLDNNLLKANRTQAQEVFYSNYRDEFNRPKPFKKVSSITESQSSLFSYYTDGVSVWVNIPDKKTGKRDDLNVLLALANSFTIQNSNKRVVFDNLNFYMKHPSTAKSDGVRVNGNQNSVFYAINSSFRYAGLNGIGTQSVGRVYILNSVATDNLVDGFNYHGSQNNFVFEYNSTGFDNGTPSENSANVTTAHDGLTILRVGSIGYRCYGPLLADVNGCYSVNIDCRMYETLNSANSFWFSDSGGTKLTEAYLINCEGGSEDTVAIGSNIENPVNVYNMPELTKTSRTIINEVNHV